MTTEDQARPGAEHRAGFCAILGPPNAGKSTFLNRVMGLPLAAVSPKPQTTRNRILGVVNLGPAGADDAPSGAHDAAAAGDAAGADDAPAGTDDGAGADDAPSGEGAPAGGAQIVYFDTPGAQAGEGPLRDFMRDELHSAASECEVALLFLDASSKGQQLPGALDPERQRALDDALSAARVPIVLVLNKVDRIGDKRELLPMIEAYSETGRYEAVVPVSALSGDGIDRAQAEVAARLPEGPRLFPEDMVTDRAERFFAAELVREQLFLQLGEEIPYATAVATENFRERKDHGDVVIDAVIHVERESQKPIVVGRAGARIKEVGTRARERIARLLGCPVHVRLHVKVTPKWSRRPGALREVGYER